ncbi:MAG: serine/threonine protein phosphatase [Candidatus Eremiobacteraeota bacterium]|nr:serine/threonine protein phosphatase [Candidatus Eremiobacteraeota bacterium]
MAGAREVARRFALRIRTQAVLLSVVPLTFLLLLCVIASVLQTRTEQTATWSQRSTNALNEADAIQKLLVDANRAILEYTRQPHASESVLAPFRMAQRDLGKHTAALQRFANDEPDQRARAGRYASLSETVMSELTLYFQLWQSGKKAQAQALVTTPRTRALNYQWQLARDEFDQAERQSTLDRYAALHREFGTLGTILLACSIAGIVLTVFVTGQFGLRIARRLLRLADNARKLGRGEPTAIIGGGDEIADLDKVYHEMTRRIQETLHQKEEALAAYERAHHVASTLQRALLPQKLPDLPGIAFDGVYVPGRTEAQVGGDWYDALRLADGRVLITIGDVAGSGLQAAVIMAAMREVIRGVAQVYADPGTMIDAADRTLKTEHPDRLVTAVVAVYDPIVRTLAYCSAGHPPPLMRSADGTVTDMPSQGLPLGLRSRDDADSRTVEIPDGATILFYTDGLTESTQDVIEGERHVRAALADPRVAAREDIAQALHDEVLRDGAHDDVAILAMRLEPISAELEGEHFRRWTFDTSDSATAQRARAVFASVLSEAGMFDDDVFTAELIFGELLSNAVRYAPGRVDVVLDWSGGATAILHFLDRGPGFVVIPRLPTDLLSERGRGLFLVWSLSEDFNVTKRADRGSHVRVVLTPRRKRGRNGVARASVPVSPADVVS